MRLHHMGVQPLVEHPPLVQHAIAEPDVGGALTSMAPLRQGSASRDHGELRIGGSVITVRFESMHPTYPVRIYRNTT